MLELLSVYIYIYIYIYVCVCVCVCTYYEIEWIYLAFLSISFNIIIEIVKLSLILSRNPWILIYRKTSGC